MIWGIVFIAILTGILVGTHEGMVHVKPIDRQHRQDWMNTPAQLWDRLNQFDLGVRGHVWTDYYHAITTGMRAGILILGAYLLGGFAYECIDTVISYHVPPTWFMFQMTAEELLPQYLWYLALVLSLGWLVYEPSYEYARYGTLMDRRYKEHCNFADVIDFHADKRIMTAIRLVLVAVVIWRMW